MQSVEYVEEILSWWGLACRILVREVAHHLGILHHVRVDGLHRQLLVVWHLDGDDILLLHQLLLADEDVLQEVLVDEVLRW